MAEGSRAVASWLILAALGLAAWFLLMHHGRVAEGAIRPGQPGTPDRTMQQPKAVRWRG